MRASGFKRTTEPKQTRKSVSNVKAVDHQILGQTPLLFYSSVGAQFRELFRNVATDCDGVGDAFVACKPNHQSQE